MAIPISAPYHPTTFHDTPIKAAMVPAAAVSDPSDALFSEIRSLFNNEAVYAEWLGMVSGKITLAQLRHYRDALKKIRDFVGADVLAIILTTPFAGKKKNISVFTTKHLGTGRGDWPESKAFHGFVLDDASADSFKGAIWDRGNDYGKGKIEAPFVSCSKVTPITATRVHQQIVFDIPWPASNKMTLNDTTLQRHGGIGWEVSWTLIKDTTIKWACLDAEGTTFLYNKGHWRLLPIGPKKTLLWYATESDVTGLDAPSWEATKALRGNIKAFSEAAHGRR